jgi:hypothetical protein
MKGTNMAADGGASGAAFGVGIKTGAFAAFGAMMVSLIAVVLGFTVVPLQAGHETRDAGRRIACGLFCSFVFGFPLAFKAIDWFPWLLSPWQSILPGVHPLMQYLAAASPFLAITAVPGFWVMAAGMLWFTKRAGKDIGELVSDARDQFKP